MSIVLVVLTFAPLLFSELLEAAGFWSLCLKCFDHRVTSVALAAAVVVVAVVAAAVVVAAVA
eukprot:7784109-Alexandrium_andersonii.AAC.1